MATNIVNTATGELGYQVPGAPIASGWQPFSAPVATTVPSGQTNTKAPATSTAVVNTDPATTDLGNISSSVNDASTNIANQANYNAANTAAATAAAAAVPPPPAATPKTPEQQIMDTPGAGNMFVYDKATGARSEVASNTPLSSNQTMTDVLHSGAQDTVSAGGTTYKQFGDGTVGAFDDNGNYIGGANMAVFNAAKGSQKAQSDLQAIQNGTYPLTAGQQSQVQQITDYYQGLIDAQKTENANVTGNTTGLQNLYGVGGTGVGISAINKTISDGAAKIADINRKMVDAVTAMKSALQTDNINLVTKLYSTYQNDIDAKQKTLDTMHSEVVNAKIKADTRNSEIAVAMAKKYTDTTDPILPSDTPAEVQTKLATSPSWKQDNTVPATLSADENAYFADMLTSGFKMSTILPNLGYGTAGTQAKIAVLKPMIDKAKAAGLTGAEFGQAMIDKTAKAAAFNKLETKRDLISSNEKAVVNDFDNVLLPAAKKISKEQWQTASPLLNRWIQTGIMTTSGDPAINNFLGSLTTTLTKYSNVVAGNIGAAGATQQMNTEIQGLLNRGLSYDAIKSYVDTIAKPEMSNTVNGFTSAQDDIKNGLNELDGTFAPGSTTSSTAGGSSSEKDPLGIR